MRRLVVPLTLFLVGLGRAHGFEPFRVQDIRVEGLQRVPTGTVFNYLPLRVGETVDPERAAEAIRSLYKTGFFQDVSLRRDGEVLVVEVAERPSIASIDIRGNDTLPTEELLTALKEIGLAEGQTFNRFLLNDVERELRRLYQSRGQYDSKIKSTVSPLPRNRVGVRIDVRESEPAKIRDIEIVGNERFSDSELRSQFELGPKRWFDFFSDQDEYAREKLAADLERLRSFYQNQGYINFTVTSTQVSVSPDRDGIYITVNISEGKQFKLGEVKLAGDLVVGEEELRGLITTGIGELFSRAQVTESVAAIRARLGGEGYAFANVNPVPEVNEAEGIVSLTYFVDPGKRVFVRRVNVLGNERTRDEVVRRELRQMEGAWLSTAAVQRSRRRLERLGFFEEVNIETPQVPGAPGQVDVNVSLKERLSGNFQIGAGYGETQGFMFNISVEQDNVFGSGDQISFAFNNSEVNRIYSARYTDRYYTQSGITRSLYASARETDAADADLADYNTDTLTVGTSFTIPIAEEDSVQFGLSYEQLELREGEDAPARIGEFISEFGSEFDSLKLNAAWVRDSRDHPFFPTEGRRQQVGLDVTVPGSELEYYKVNYSIKQFLPITKRWTLSLETGLAYGDGYGRFDELPFFEKFYAGGVSSVRGYRGNSLGERDEDDNPLGGNARVIGTVELIMPVPFTDIDSVRLTTFIDAGNVFDEARDIEFDELRASAGIGLVWMSPLGALTMSLAEPLNDKPNDKLQAFQFTIGSTF